MNKRNISGFTIVEAAVASSILALVFTGFLIGFVEACRMQFMADNCYTATVVARNRTEYARIYPYGSLIALNETNTTVDLNGNPCSTGNYWRTTVIAPSGNNPNCMEILVRVTYMTGPGRTSETPVVMNTMRGVAD